ncbi:NADPH dehydrogenase [Microdochium trichocladiopsis]|uniref:NADPH dehydrogenase n=1 Tax=Microdochium trichocladiopsis TaxID=1682393 RepID=A0A9P8XZ56_9PEZI|nr:NADPH dehydrogenase [Microdochium trichocladiopsis]KAH7025803.1 NADPH dehydrogenase [Microdochium trichocladiopsis]
MADLKLNAPLTLRCGLTLPNRLVNPSMAECLADKDSLPTSEACISAYECWAEGGWGLILTGNVQVDRAYIGQAGDMAYDEAVDRAKIIEAWTKWSATIGKNGTSAIMQLNHPGRQSGLGAGRRSIFAKSLAPSAVPMNLGDGLWPRFLVALLFGTPREMTHADIKDVVGQFARAAKAAWESGFAGVEIHAAHGYLLSQFLSPEINRRTDEYGGSAVKRALIVVEIVKAVREVVPKDFCVGVKFNSADYSSGAEAGGALEDRIDQVRAIAEAGIDFLEVSGGTYENPTAIMGYSQPETKSARTLAREAYFLEFAQSIRKSLPNLHLMVTGGFRTRRGMEAAVAEGDCDLVGIARPATVYPHLPRDIILNPDVADDDAVLRLEKVQPPWLLTKIKVKSVGAGWETVS